MIICFLISTLFLLFSRTILIWTKSKIKSISKENYQLLYQLKLEFECGIGKRENTASVLEYQN